MEKQRVIRVTGKGNLSVKPDHMLSMQQILEKLYMEYAIEAERKSIYADLEELAVLKIDVNSRRVGRKARGKRIFGRNGYGILFKQAL